MTTTAVARLAGLVDEVKANPTMADQVTVPFLDAVEVLQLIEALCGDHTACAWCDAVLCRECGVGDHGDVEECPDIHCRDCVWQCRICCVDIHDDHDYVRD